MGAQGRVRLGGAQVAVTAAVLAAVGLALGQTWQSALVMGLGLGMSSTAFVLQVLAERKQLTARHGRSAFAILLFQDLTVIPLLALIPLLSTAPTTSQSGNLWLAAGQAVAVIVAVILGGRLLLRPVLRTIAESGIQEIFTAAALLVVIGVSLLMVGVGLPMSLGAFLAGVLLADSEYRHELEANIEPFKGLLLGLFFISVGMAADSGQVLQRPLLVLAGVIGLMGTKAAILYALGRVNGHSPDSSRALAAALCQGGEFAFVLFALAEGSNVMQRGLVDLLVVVVTLSMAATPLALAASDLIGRRLRSREPAQPYDTIEPEGQPPVIIADFGRVGQIVGRILLARGIPITALDKDPPRSNRCDGSAARCTTAMHPAWVAAGRGRADSQRSSCWRWTMSKVAADRRDVAQAFPASADLRARAVLPRLPLDGLRRGLHHSRDAAVVARNGQRSAAGTRHTGVAGHGSRGTFRSYDGRLLQTQHAVYHDETQLRQNFPRRSQELDGCCAAIAKRLAPTLRAGWCSRQATSGKARAREQGGFGGSRACA